MTNDPRDDAMREIEAALVQLFYDAAGMCVSPDVFAGTLALIRSKLPQPDADMCGITAKMIEEGEQAVREGRTIGLDELRAEFDAEHERAVEAWREKAGKFRIWSEPRRQWFYDLDCAAFDEALRLMRWQPKTKETT